MPEDMRDRMPNRMPEDMPDRMPGRMPEDMSDRMPVDMPDRMSEDLPVTKRINVMEGITRSKIIFNMVKNNQPVLNIDRLVIVWDPLVWIKHRQMCTLVLNVDPEPVLDVVFLLVLSAWWFFPGGEPRGEPRGSTANQYCYADFWLPWPCSHFANVEPCPANLIWRALESQTSIGRTQSTQWFSRQACYRFGMFWLCQTELPGRSAHGPLMAFVGEYCVSKKQETTFLVISKSKYQISTHYSSSRNGSVESSNRFPGDRLPWGSGCQLMRSP